MSKRGRLSSWDVVYAADMVIACLISYWIITYARSRFVDRPSDLLRGMWAVVATVFVFRETRVRSLSAGTARLIATCVSFALCLLYLWVFPFTATALRPLAVSAAGVAIFASGLVLAAHRVKLTSPTVIVGSLVSLIVQPALFFIIIKFAGVSGAMSHAAFVASTMPTSTISVLFAQQYATCEAETRALCS